MFLFFSVVCVCVGFRVWGLGLGFRVVRGLRNSEGYSIERRISQNRFWFEGTSKPNDATARII